MNSNCYEKGHTPDRVNFCAKCGEPLYRTIVKGCEVWHTQAELDQLWKGVDREAARILSEEER